MNKDTNQSMAQINAYKMNGLGNNFIIIDRRHQSLEIKKETILKIGGQNNMPFDQLIVMEKKEDNVFPITIFNPDGIEVGACGNGSRCIAYLIFNENKDKNILIKADKRVLAAEIYDNKMVKIDMGIVKYKNWKDIPLKDKNLNPNNLSFDFLDKVYGDGICVNVGNPHIIFFTSNCEKINIKKIGPSIECHKYFPERVNVTFAEVIDKNNVKINVWERGAGQTKACGTAACATVVAAFLKNFTNNNCNIHFEEGILKINYEKKINRVYMTGPVSDIEKINLEV